PTRFRAALGPPARVYSVGLMRWLLALTATAMLASSLPEQADEIRVSKSTHTMRLLKNGRVLRRYFIALGGNPVGHKQREGDKRTPEGRYTISGRNPKSSYHLSLRISYPNDADRERALKAGVSPGGDIMIHGLPNRLPDLGALHRL